LKQELKIKRTSY